MAKVSENPLSYLPYVTLRDAWSELRTYLLVWLVFTGISIALIFFFQIGATAVESHVPSSTLSRVPGWVWFCLAFALISLVLR